MSIVVVSGYRRCGTSLMMHALYSGMKGGVALFSPDFEEFNPNIDGYQPNPNGLWEVGFRQYMSPPFLRGMPDGSLVKILYDGLPNLPKGDYKIIFMTRDVDEIEASLARSDECLTEHAKRSGKIRRSQDAIDDKTEFLPFCSFRDYDQVEIDHVLGIMDTRKDVDLIKVDFADVIRCPTNAFRKIRSTPLGRTRIDIDVAKAAAVIEPKLYRSKVKEHGYNTSRDDRTRTHSINSAQ